MRGRGRGGKRNRAAQRHGDFKDARPNEWKRSRHSASQTHANSTEQAGWNPFVRESPAFEAFYKVRQA